VFARTRLPHTMASDNGPQWVAEEFQQYCRGNSMRHCVITLFLLVNWQNFSVTITVTVFHWISVTITVKVN
jgi:hypothetical protein